MNDNLGGKKIKIKNDFIVVIKYFSSSSSCKIISLNEAKRTEKKCSNYNNSKVRVKKCLTLLFQSIAENTAKKSSIRYMNLC